MFEPALPLATNAAFPRLPSCPPDLTGVSGVDLLVLWLFLQRPKLLKGSSPAELQTSAHSGQKGPFSFAASSVLRLSGLVLHPWLLFLCLFSVNQVRIPR